MSRYRRQERTEPARWHRVGFGTAAILVALSVYLPFSPIRAYASTAKDYVEQAIGSKGWQPNARAFLFHVPFHRQEHALSCEVASLRTALLGVGVDVPEWELWLGLPKDYTSKRYTDKGIVWGDPSKGFVGNVDGRMPSTGYGVFIEPLTVLANDYTSTTRIRVDDPKAIDTALSKGHPVITWSALGDYPSIREWKTPEGKQIQAPIYEHTIVIVGYRGSADWIEGLYVIDPLNSIRYETWKEFQMRTAYFDHVGLEIRSKERG
ncbi:hypothetical protein GF380_03250 [Candidatus Uhrbacteria bacterium]|nr:hypothetical protein [Candidatus Uhrbacteria bacterium]